MRPKGGARRKGFLVKGGSWKRRLGRYLCGRWKGRKQRKQSGMSRLKLFLLEAILGWEAEGNQRFVVLARLAAIPISLIHNHDGGGDEDGLEQQEADGAGRGGSGQAAGRQGTAGQRQAGR